MARPWGHAHPCVPDGLLPTHRTHKALGMPDALQGRQVIVRHGALAALAFRGKHGQEVLAAVRLPTALVETCGEGVGMGTCLGEGSQLGAVGHGHGGAQDRRQGRQGKDHGGMSDGAMGARAALWAGIPGVGAIGARAGLWEGYPEWGQWGQDPHACPLGYTIISEHLPAVGTEEVLGVPGLVQGCEDFLQEEAR